MTQTLAILHDAYRELHARKLFWIALAISLLVVLGFAAIGVRDGNITLLVWETPLSLAELQTTEERFYKGLFTSFGIGFWLAWLASILALISTAGMFPNLISSGSIGLMLSKPISRTRLFLTKYLGGLLFVTLQVSVFTLASFLVLGLRAGLWEFGLFLAIPLVVVFFSYLFAVCVLLGVLTRSTVAALLLTLLFWFGLWAVHQTERTLLWVKLDSAHRIEALEAHLQERLDASATDPQPDHQPAWDQMRHWEESRWYEQPVDSLQAELASSQQITQNVELAQRVALGIKAVLPKTSETIEVLRHTLIEAADLPETEAPEAAGFPEEAGPGTGPQSHAALEREYEQTVRKRSTAWILGSSLTFELLILAFATWLFCRRDF